MSKVVSRRRGALSINGIQQTIKEHAKSVTDSEKYGKSVWCDLTEWEDGTFSISSYDGSTSIRLSGSFKPKEADMSGGLDF
jgi:hypothetical protein